MDKFNAIEVFIKVAECGGFAAAARNLAISPPAVTRTIAMLEDRLGTRLFVRTTRSVRLTESGVRFLADGRRILTELEDAENAATGTHTEPRGVLRITSPVLFGRIFVTPILAEFLNLYPMVNAETLFVDRIVNLMDEGLDVAIRIGELPDSSLIATRVGSVRRVTVASSDYLVQHKPLLHPKDLINHQLIQPLGLGTAKDWVFYENDEPISIRVEPRLRMNTNDAVIEMAERAWGVAPRLLSYQVASHVANGRLKILLSEFEPPALPVHIVHQEGTFVSAKLRSFVDFMAQQLRADPILN